MAPTISATPAAIIYCRVSSDEQARGYSLPTQEASCRKFCAERGYAVLDVFKDAHTGTELDRPGLNAAIEVVDAHKPDVVVLLDVDRLARPDSNENALVGIAAEQLLTQHGAYIEYVQGGRSDSDTDMLSLGLRKLIAGYENRQRVERSRRGKNGRVQAGGVLVAARPAFGYRYVAGKRTGHLELDPDEAPVVADIFRWCVEDRLTTLQIAKRLHDAGVPTRGDSHIVVHKETGRCVWQATTVARILRNEIYVGVWHWGKTRAVKRGGRRVQEARPREEWLAVDVPRLIDDETWQGAQTQLSRNQQFASRNAKRDYLLRGLVLCESCGRRWGGSYRKETRRGYYRCGGFHASIHETGCTAGFGLEQTKLETAILDAVRAFLLDPETRRSGVAAEQERLRMDRERLGEDLATADRHLASVEVKLSRLLDQTIAGSFPAEMVEARSRELLAEREQRAREREQLLARFAATDRPDLEAAVEALTPVVERAFASASPVELRQLLEVLRVEVHVLDRHTVRLSGVVGGAAGSVVNLSQG